MTKQAHERITVDSITYRFVVLERQGPLSPVGETIRFSAVEMTTDEWGDERQETLDRFPTFAAANDCAKKALADLKRNYSYLASEDNS